MSEKIRDYAKLAGDIIHEVGGKQNIVNATRCATRLRLVLTEVPQRANEKISAMPGVITVVEKGGQFQVVIGNHVGDVFEEVSVILGLDKETDNGEVEVKQNFVNRIIATMSGVFAPIVYLLAGAGMLQGFLIIIKTLMPAATVSGTFQIFDLMSWAPFTFLPILLSVTAAKHFKCNQFTALMCSFVLLSPSLAAILAEVSAGSHFTLFGFPLAETSYMSTVLPALIMVWFLSNVEKIVKKLLPEMLRQLLAPLICFIVVAPLTLLIIGPISETAAKGIANGYNFLNQQAPVLTAAIFGGLWEVLVIFGVHWGMNPIMLSDMGVNGHYTMGVYIAIAVAAQMGAVFAVARKTQSKELRNVSVSAGITAIFGITEPTIYGVTLRLKKPFICACIASAAASGIAAVMHTTYYVYAGLAGPLTFINALGDGDTQSLLGAVVSTAAAVACSFILVQIMWKEDRKAINEAGEEKTEEKEKRDNGIAGEKGAWAEIVAPIKGKVMHLSEIQDEVFSSGAMGAGVAIVPGEGKVYAPADGSVSVLFDTFHAIGFQTVQGAELLIHVGMDTVKLEGEYFTPHVKTGDVVQKGTLLLEFDLQKIAEEGYELTTPIVITNSDEYESIVMEQPGEILAGDKIMALK